jgi:hypothetical protein
MNHRHELALAQAGDADATKPHGQSLPPRRRGMAMPRTSQKSQMPLMQPPA